jgi:hypothetical protein
MNEGNVHSIYETELKVFWFFRKFFEIHNLNDHIHQNQQTILKIFLIVIDNILNNNYKVKLKLLFQKQFFSLIFL